MNAVYGFTVFWVTAVAGYVLARNVTIFTLAPNELGDFLAGCFSPLAFAWVLAAVLVQSRQLEVQRNEARENGDALRAQSDQLKRSVEQLERQAGHMEAAFRQREEERITEVTRDLTRRLLHRMHLMARDTQDYGIVSAVDPVDGDEVPPLFGKEPLFLDCLNRDDFDSATREALAHLEALKAVILDSNYKIVMPVSGVHVITQHLATMQGLARELVSRGERCPLEVKAIFPFDRFRTLVEETDQVLRHLESLAPPAEPA
jgi:hypothetical protein